MTSGSPTPTKEWIDGIEVGKYGDHRGTGEGVSEPFEAIPAPAGAFTFRLGGARLEILLVCGTKKRQAPDFEATHAYWEADQQEETQRR